MISKCCKFVLLLLCLFVLWGCASIIIPVSDGKALSGRKITAENTTFIKSGVTTRREVIQTLGQPDMDFKDLRIIAYSWNVLGAYVPWVVGTPGGGGAGIMEISDKYVLLIAFEKEDRVSRFEIKKLWPLDTIRDHVLKWTGREGIDVPKPSTHVVGVEIPKDQAVLYIYRPGGWGDAPLLHQPVISVDEKAVAELRKGEYISTVLQPGFHVVSVNPDPNPTSPLRPEQRPVRTFSFDALPNTAYYLKIRVRWGLGALDPELTIYPAEDAVPVIKELRPTW